MKDLLDKLGPLSPLAGSLGIFGLILAALVQIFLPKLTVSVWGLISISLPMLLLAGLGSLQEIRGGVQARVIRHGTNLFAMTAAFVGMVVLVNILAHRYSVQWDLTYQKRFTLSPQTQRVLKGLKAPVEAIGFFPSTAPFRSARVAAEAILRQYRRISDRFEYRFVDPEIEPSVARRLGIRRYGTIVFASQRHLKHLLWMDERVFSAPEIHFTSAILEVTGVRQKRIYFLGGHGERDPLGPGPQGFSLAHRALRRELYQVSTINLDRQAQVPRDCAVLIVAGPRKPFPKHHQEAISAFLKGHGKALFLLDPHVPEGISNILSPWGVKTGKGTVLDEGSHLGPDKTVPVVLREGLAPVVIAQGLDAVYFPGATAVMPTEELFDLSGEEVRSGWPFVSASFDTLAVLPIATTTAQSFLERDLESLKHGQRGDIKGPLALGCMVMASKPLGEQEGYPPSANGPITRVVVIGDSDFAANEHFTNGGNSDLFLNAVNWLAEEEQLISIRPKRFTRSRLVVSPRVLSFMRYSSTLLLPIVVLLVGGIIWWRRR